MSDSTTHESTEVKTCIHCGETKPATTEYFNRILPRLNLLRAECVRCTRKRAVAMYSAILENEYIGDGRLDVLEVNREAIERWRTEKQAAIDAYVSAPERHYHVRKRNAEGSHTAADRKAQYDRQKGKCYYCHKKVGDTCYQIDHIVPLSRGGSDWPDNLVMTCKSCNSSKRDRLPSEWPEGGRLL